MALSNLRREPRRELIEQGFGALVVIAWVIADYLFIPWSGHLLGIKKADDMVGWAILGSILFAVAPFIFMFLLLAMHGLGEMVCGTLRSLGWDPRPRQRY